MTARTFDEAINDWRLALLGKANGQQWGAHRYGADWGPGKPLAPLGAENHYDPLYDYLRLRAFTGNPAFDADIEAARYQLRDTYLLPNSGLIPGFYPISNGLRLDWERNRDARSRAALLLYAAQSNYATGGNGYDYSAAWWASRETAFGLEANLDAEACGADHQPHTEVLVAWTFGYIDKWVSDPAKTNTADPYLAVQCFMVGLSLRALIAYHRDNAGSPDPARSGLAAQVPGKVKPALDYLLNHAWDANARAWPYWDRDTSPLAEAAAKAKPGTAPPPGIYDGGGQPKPAPDLNPLIGPAFAWYADLSGDPAYMRIYESAFAGATMAGGDGPNSQKAYNQAIFGGDLDAQALRAKFVERERISNAVALLKSLGYTVNPPPPIIRLSPTDARLGP